MCQGLCTSRRENDYAGRRVSNDSMSGLQPLFLQRIHKLCTPGEWAKRLGGNASYVVVNIVNIAITNSLTGEKQLERETKG